MRTVKGFFRDWDIVLDYGEFVKDSVLPYVQIINKIDHFRWWVHCRGDDLIKSFYKALCDVKSLRQITHHSAPNFKFIIDLKKGICGAGIDGTDYKVSGNCDEFAVNRLIEAMKMEFEDILFDELDKELESLSDLIKEDRMEMSDAIVKLFEKTEDAVLVNKHYGSQFCNLLHEIIFSDEGMKKRLLEAAKAKEESEKKE